MSAYYNEIDPFAAAWLRELIKAGHIAPGEVDERSIEDVQPSDVAGFRQCHFFAGIGGWSLALRLAGWPDDEPVWTGSCPCQPFSTAGSQVGGDDPRHLWPTWFQFIKERRPNVCFGEQVESAVGHGWVDLVCDDLESEGYAFCPVGLPAACVGAFHERSRIWFVADSDGSERWANAEGRRDVVNGTDARRQEEASRPELHRPIGLVADISSRGQREHGSAPRRAGPADERGQAGALDDSERLRAGRNSGSEGRSERQASSGWEDEGSRQLQALDSGAVDIVGHADVYGLQGSAQPALQRARRRGEGAEAGRASRSFWADCDWLQCRDGKARPVEPGTFPLAHGIPARVGRLRGYGNAIVPEVAAAFIEAYVEAVS